MKSKTIVLGILLLALVCVGCGGGSKPAPAATPQSWVGTWTGQVDWVSPTSASANPASGDDVTMTITLDNTNSCSTSPCQYFYIVGTDVGPLLGNIGLGGGMIVYNSVPNYAANPGLYVSINNANFTLNGNTITVTGIGTNAQDQSINLTMGTLTR